MKTIRKQPSKFKEFLCILFGHDWMEYGSSKCLKHNVKYNEYNTCRRCGLENHDIKYCIQCFHFYGKTGEVVKVAKSAISTAE